MTSLNATQQKQLSKQLGDSKRRPKGRFVSAIPINNLATSSISVDQSGALEQSAALQQCSVLRQQLSAQSHELALATQRADRLEQELIQFVSATSHDLGNPLRAISGFSSLLAQDCDNNLNEKGNRYLDRIESGANRMQTLLDSLCDYARFSTIELQQNPTDLNIIVGNVLVDLNETAQQANAVVTHDVLPVILADKVQLSHLMRHLIDNSLSFAGVNQLQVRVSAQRVANQWLVKVQDNGRGIPDEAHRIGICDVQSLRLRRQCDGRHRCWTGHL